MVQIVLSIIMFGFVGIIATVFYMKRRNEKADEYNYTKQSFENLIELIKIEFMNLTKDDEVIVSSSAVYQARRKNKARLREALTEARNGRRSAISIVTAVIRDVVARELPDEEACCELLDFNNLEYLSPNYKWEILLYVLGKKYDDEVIVYLDDKYDLTQLREIDTSIGKKMRREFSIEMLDDIFDKEVIQSEEFTVDYPAMLDIIAKLLFIMFDGINCVTSLRQQKVDGWHYGTSGSIRFRIDGKRVEDVPYRDTNSVWVQMKAKWVHFVFLDFGTTEEMKRVTKQITAYGNLGPMTEKNPLKVTEDERGSRITAIGPPSGECWACFVRNFTLSIYTMQQLLDHEWANNWELVSDTLYFIAKGEQTCGFTGQQNTGKTTMMKSFIEYCELMCIRVFEMSFELALREIYPYMDIFTAKPTDYVSGQRVQDIFKKTDAYLSIVGEVAESIVGANLIRFGILASAFTICSQHGINDWGFITGFAQDLVASGMYTDMDAAMSVVLDVLQLNCHLDFVNGKRVIAYISQIIKESELKPYPLLDNSNNIVDAVDQLSGISREFFTRTTDRVKFTSRYIVKYNPTTKSYEPNDFFTYDKTAKMLSKFNDADKVAFVNYYKKYWKQGEEVVSNGNE